MGFTKELVSIDFQSMPTRQILSLIAQESGKNLLIDDDVQGSMSLHLKKVTWSQIMSLVLDVQHLGVRTENNIWVVAPEKKLENQEPQVSKVFRVYYVRPKVIAPVVQEAFNANEVKVIPLEDSHQLLIQSIQDKLASVADLIHGLDLPKKQVEISAKIVNIDANYEKELGVRFGLMVGHNLGGGVTGASNSAEESSGASQLATDLPVLSKGTGHLGLALFKLTNGTKLDLELSALEANGHAEVISRPRLMTADGATAIIAAGQEIPYQEKTSGGATNVAFKKAVLSLKVTPEIVPGGKVLLSLHVNQDKRSSEEVQGVPAIDTRQIATEVMVRNGETLVLGGIYEYERHHQLQRVPFLGRLPLLGALFRYQKWVNNRRELLIFITPKEAT